VEEELANRIRGAVNHAKKHTISKADVEVAMENELKSMNERIFEKGGLASLQTPDRWSSPRKTRQSEMRQSENGIVATKAPAM